MILSESTRLCSAIDGEGAKILADKIAQLEETIEASWENVAQLKDALLMLVYDADGIPIEYPTHESVYALLTDTTEAILKARTA